MINSIQRDQIPVCSCESFNKMIYFNKANKDIHLLFYPILESETVRKYRSAFLINFYSIAFWKIWINWSFWVRIFTKGLGKWNTFQFVIYCGSKNTEQQIIVFTVPAYWLLSQRLKYKKAWFYWGDHSKLTSSFVCQCFFRFSRFLSP